MEEKTYHNRLINLLFNTCSRVVRELLPILIRQQYVNLSVNDFVQLKKTDIISTRKHLRSNKKLFPTLNQPTDIQTWDLQLLIFMVEFIIQQDQEIKEDVEILKKNRNELCHGQNTYIAKDVYDAKLKMIMEVNERLLYIIGDRNLTEEILAQTDQVINDKININEALNSLQDWLEMDKRLLEERCTLNEDQKFILDKLRSITRSRKQEQHIPDTRLVLSVKNCNKVDEDKICRQFVDVIRTKCGKSVQFSSLKDEENEALSKIIEETLQEFLDEDQITVKAELGCVIISVKTLTFESMERLWTKCVNGILTNSLNKLQSYLRETYRNDELELEVTLPEVEFWEIINKIVINLKAQPPIENHEDVFGIAEDLFEGGCSNTMENSDVFNIPRTTIAPSDVTPPERSCLKGNVIDAHADGEDIEIDLRPRSLKQLEHMKMFSSTGKLSSSIQKMAKEIEKILQLKDLQIDAKFFVMGAEAGVEKLPISFEKIDLSSPVGVTKTGIDISIVEQSGLTLTEKADALVFFGEPPWWGDGEFIYLFSGGKDLLEDLKMKKGRRVIESRRIQRLNFKAVYYVCFPWDQHSLTECLEMSTAAGHKSIVFSLIGPRNYSTHAVRRAITEIYHHWKSSVTDIRFLCLENDKESMETITAYFEIPLIPRFIKSKEDDDKYAYVTKEGPQISIIKMKPIQLKTQGDVLVIVSTEDGYELKLIGENRLYEKLRFPSRHYLPVADVVECGKPDILKFKNVYLCNGWHLGVINYLVPKCLVKAAADNHRSLVFMCLGIIDNSDDLVKEITFLAKEYTNSHPSSSVNDVKVLILNDESEAQPSQVAKPDLVREKEKKLQKSELHVFQDENLDLSLEMKKKLQTSEKHEKKKSRIFEVGVTKTGIDISIVEQEGLTLTEKADALVSFYGCMRWSDHADCNYLFLGEKDLFEDLMMRKGIRNGVIESRRIQRLNFTAVYFVFDSYNTTSRTEFLEMCDAAGHKSIVISMVGPRNDTVYSARCALSIINNHRGSSVTDVRFLFMENDIKNIMMFKTHLEIKLISLAISKGSDDKDSYVTEEGLQISIVKMKPIQLKTQGDVLVIVSTGDDGFELKLIGENRLYETLRSQPRHYLPDADLVECGKPDILNFKNVYLCKEWHFSGYVVTECLVKAAADNHRSLVFMCLGIIGNSDDLAKEITFLSKDYANSHPSSSVNDVEVLILNNESKAQPQVENLDLVREKEKKLQKSELHVFQDENLDLSLEMKRKLQTSEIHETKNNIE